MSEIKTEAETYTILAVEQGTEAWKQERLKRITASQTPILMGISPYQTAAQLLEEKLTGKELPVSSYKQYLFQKGHDAELAAREWVETHLNVKFASLVILSKKCPDLLASLDGFNQEKHIILEAKYMGAKSLEDVKVGKIKAHHECQVQAQLLASGASKCIYFATTEEGDSAVTEILPSAALQAKITEAVNGFMKDLHEFTQHKKELLQKYAPKKDKNVVFPVRKRR